jgi:hypothetical protein
MGTYQSPEIYKPDYSKLVEGVGDFGKNYGAAKAAQAQLAAAKAKAAAKQAALDQKELRKKNNAIMNLTVDMSLATPFEGKDMQTKYKDFIVQRKATLESLDYLSDDWNTEVSNIKTMIGTSDDAISLLNHEIEDLANSFDIKTVNGVQQLIPKATGIGGAQLATNDQGFVSIIHNIKFKGGKDVNFDYKNNSPGLSMRNPLNDGMLDSNGNITTDPNLSVSEFHLQAGDTGYKEDIFLDFRKYKGLKPDGYDIIGVTDPTALNTTIDNDWKIFGAGYNEAYDIIETKINNPSAGTVTIDEIKSYEQANQNVRDRMLREKGTLQPNQSNWQLLGGGVKKVDLDGDGQPETDTPEIYTDSPENREMYAILEANRMLEVKGKASSLTQKINNLDIPQIQQEVAVYQKDGIPGIEPSSLALITGLRGIDPSTGKPYPQGQIGEEFYQKDNYTPDELRNLAHAINRQNISTSELAGILTAMTVADGHTYTSGDIIKNKIADDYKQEYAATHGGASGSRSEILKFASGNDAQQPASVYVGADVIKGDQLYRSDGAYASKRMSQTEDQVLDLLYAELDLTNKQRQYLKNPNLLPKKATTSKTTTKKKTKIPPRPANCANGHWNGTAWVNC